jgi:NAD(P)-dependent dehydrogenase (short-subunit alcohol dehydrogenase family)
MTRAAVPKVTDGSGSVLFVAATAVDSPPATLAAYVASKAGIVALVHSLGKELADRSIRVNAIAPTTIDTPANREAMPDADFSSWTRPEKIARVLAWLASEDASAVRGAIVPV